MIKIVWDYLEALGHENIKATHETTMEITRDDHVTEKGDCIIACCASKSLNDLKPELKELITNNNTLIVLALAVNNHYDYVIGYGSKLLTLESTNKIIIRKSKYVDNATLMINANKSAKDLNRGVVNKLKNKAKIRIWILGIGFE